MARKLLKKISAIAVALLIFLCPLLLLFDFEKFIPLVLTVWLLSVVYFIFIKSRY